MGCDLMARGFAPLVLVSSPRALYGEYEHTFAIRWAAREGCAAEKLEGVPHTSQSTAEEAAMFSRLLRERRAQSYLLVTSDFHTRRAGGIFRRAIPDIPAIVVAAPFRHYNPDAWWQTRESAETFFYEWVKTVTNWFGL
jgi:uncharacterized SAM-binding protein YcdF (DUF218 family)